MNVSGEQLASFIGRAVGCYQWDGNSSVGIMQQLSREILLTQGLPGELELHKGTPAPVWFTRTIAEASEARAWWQVYLDNFMSAECSEGTYEGLDASPAGQSHVCVARYGRIDS